MEKIFRRTGFLTLLMLVAFAVAGQEKVWDFEETGIGKIPAGWKVEATNPKGKVATWEVVRDSMDGKTTKILGMIKANDDYSGTFNICWTDSVRFSDGEIEVTFKAVKGSEDQGGGIIWRVKDANNYYVARANPLENNFRLYYVKDGSRITLDSKGVDVPSNKWNMMKIVHKGKKIEGYLNGVKLLEKEDDTLPEAGGVGVWTKADAATYFDNFRVRPYDKEIH